MNENKVLEVITAGGISHYDVITPLLTAMAIQDSKLTKEQKAERREKRRLLQEERLRQSLIIQNICPNCKGKLIRGKKDKKNDYKRMWNCRDCGNSHSV